MGDFDGLFGQSASSVSERAGDPQPLEHDDALAYQEHAELVKRRREAPIQAIVAGHAVLFHDGTTSFLPVEMDWPYAGPDLREPGA